MKRKWKAVLAAVACYALLLGLLTICEGRAPEGHIRTLADAFWYSVVTMTTVGYGDLYPVTITGRLIGLLLMITPNKPAGKRFDGGHVRRHAATQ